MKSICKRDEIYDAINDDCDNDFEYLKKSLNDKLESRDSQYRGIKCTLLLVVRV